MSLLLLASRIGVVSGRAGLEESLSVGLVDLAGIAESLQVFGPTLSGLHEALQGAAAPSYPFFTIRKKPARRVLR